MQQSNWRPLPSVKWRSKVRQHIRRLICSVTHTQCAGVRRWRPSDWALSLNNGAEREGFHKKQRHLERFWIRLIRFVFCLLFRRHDQSDISPICVSSGGEEEEFGECCLLISSGSVRCALGMVIKTRKLWIMKSVDQKWNKTADLCFISGLLVTGLESLCFFFPVFQLLKGGGGWLSVHAQSSLLRLSGRRKIKGMWMAWPRSSESESNWLFWSYLIFMNNFLDISFAPWSRPLLQCYTMMS